MATVAHCLYCFEVLSASLEKRKALTLKQVEELWAQYEVATGLKQSELKPSRHSEADTKDLEMTGDDEDYLEKDETMGDAKAIPSVLQSATISRLQAPSPADESSSSTPSTLSTTSSQAALGGSSKSSSKSSFFSFPPKAQSPVVEKEEEHPLFVTWNTLNSRGHKSLRGCIGTFEAQELSIGLKSYALTAALDDTRFSPITLSELPSLSVNITLLMAFTPCANPLDWDLETHGIRISFTHHGRRFGSTYLPDVALEQGWSKEETIVSLMRKAGWSGRSSEWKKVTDLKCIRYQGMKADVGYQNWKQWRSWVDQVSDN